ncbi:MAG: phosphoribosylglycinamide formyltransferase [bacterium]
MRLAVLASGQGSNLRAIYHAIASGKLTDVEISLVISNNSKSGAIEFARERGIPSVHISLLVAGDDQTKFENELLNAFERFHIDLIVLAGYMKLLPDIVIAKYHKRIINIHPALLPDFGGQGMYGLHVHRAVLASGNKVSGATVHFVEHEFDSGEIILQKKCEVLETDTPELLSERVRILEHEILPIAIQQIISISKVINE